MKPRFLLLCTAVALSIVGGCGRGQNVPAAKISSGGPGNTPSAPTGKPTGSKGSIGLSVLTLTNPFFKVIAQSMKEAAAKHGYEVIEDHNRRRESGKITIAAELPGDGQKDKGYKAAEDALQAHPALAGIFAINDPSALGARAALEKAGRTDQVVLVGFDGQPEGKQAIRDGKIYADPVQFPDKIGVETIRAIVKHFEGEAVPPEILIPTALYRKADAEKDESLKR